MPRKWMVSHFPKLRNLGGWTSPGGPVVKAPGSQCGGAGFNPWSRHNSRPAQPEGIKKQTEMTPGGLELYAGE